MFVADGWGYVSGDFQIFDENKPVIIGMHKEHIKMHKIESKPPEKPGFKCEVYLVYRLKPKKKGLFLVLNEYDKYYPGGWVKREIYKSISILGIKAWKFVGDEGEEI